MDFVWYPRATCTDPASFCYVASVRECPVKLLDGLNGRVCKICNGIAFAKQSCIANITDSSVPRIRLSITGSGKSHRTASRSMPPQTGQHRCPHFGINKADVCVSGCTAGMRTPSKFSIWRYLARARDCLPRRPRKVGTASKVRNMLYGTRLRAKQVIV